MNCGGKAMNQPGPKAPALFNAKIRKNQGKLPPAFLSLTPLPQLIPITYMWRGIPVHVPEPSCRICCGVRGPAHCTRPNFDYNGHDND